ncbi:MAG: hypothetical protein A3I26_03170 [Candidatus Yanofskybacteria bacterium RIFCSPLOWO2_02_FULL_43_10]|uniref:Uncharacterized protein n=2 Tax=Parcubacteria group TaxID=1794811 RepID=A0A1G2RPQ2_9BACT|nr:MAG: hypothetical protein A2742_02065 [Candidatus Yanofskybacteria bacterium RIFCSPHIGHO2_01_FULL_43_32]OGN11792.1 MAG: hypothetical protein A3C69_00300 [Candidatus Yanofskybacteria bacterium RIFCSPHIGHO2_02_FULL_43_12]OGN18037.1 MAG: hypothetical protein A3E34_01035 [Candidatus Yanofskybacteria bacterium RIFCSPHIGHO2_12_FULL_43_11]OGN29123.1 MAG: hypothetical protein A3I26_03170 [Candidatus Yanofskybacteria bacterium RIFCSPLOWO2_02_FULL_43_10]OGN34408.1 MAG: hypothetical protein A3G51_03405
MSKLNPQSFIQESGLSGDDKKVWDEALAVIDDDESQNLLDIFNEDADQLQWFTDNLKNKKEAILSGNKEEFNKILDEEREMLNKLSQ